MLQNGLAAAYLIAAEQSDPPERGLAEESRTSLPVGAEMGEVPSPRETGSVALPRPIRVVKSKHGSGAELVGEESG